jgi:hypothetical protein
MIMGAFIYFASFSGRSDNFSMSSSRESVSDPEPNLTTEAANGLFATSHGCAKRNLTSAGTN